MRDFALVGFILASLPVGLVRPYYALLVYAWLSYGYPQTYVWDFAQVFPGAKLMTFAAIGGAVLRGDIDTAPLRQPVMKVMALLFICFTFSTALALYPEYAWIRWQYVSKVVLMAFVAAMLLTTRQRLRMFLLVVTLSLGFYGIKGGLFSFSTGGEFTVGAAGTSILADNNAVGLALNMCLPMMWYLAQAESGWIKRFLQVGFFLTIPAIMFTYSRASAITLGVILLILVLKSRQAILLIGVLLIGGLFLVPHIPDKWWNRQQTTLTYEDDGSAMSRINNWKVVWRIALDNPFTGLGFDFMNNEVFAKYSPEFLARYGHSWNTHSIYLAILGSHGFPGFLLFMSMIGLTCTTCWRIRRQTRGRPDLKWCATYCNMVTLSLLAFLINGAFVNMEYFDLPYHLVAVTACLSVVCHHALSGEPDKIVELGTAVSAVPAV